jgi:hypothetical protein
MVTDGNWISLIGKAVVVAVVITKKTVQVLLIACTIDLDYCFMLLYNNVIYHLAMHWFFILLF